MDLLLRLRRRLGKRIRYRLIVILSILMLVLVNYSVIKPKNNSNNESFQVTIAENEELLEPTYASRGITRSPRALSFTENSTGLPSSGDYNYIAFGDFNIDGNIDIAFGGEDYGTPNTVGLKAYTGNGGTSWSSASTGLWTGNSWGGLALEDADADGYIELYATDEYWGTDNSSGLKVWEYRSSSWTDSSAHVSTPLSSGRPDNVVVTNITGDSRLDIVVSNSSGNGLTYFENTGGNPVTWQRRSNGLATSSEFTAIAVADMNKDGLKDIVALDYGGGEHMYIQRTTGSLWAEYSTGLSISGTHLGVALGDVNSDSHMDIIYGGHGNGIKCLLGNSGGTGGTSFSWTQKNTGLPTSGRYPQIQVVDIDLDNDLDIVAPEAASSGIGIQIYLGNGSTLPGMNIGWTLASSTNLTATGLWYGCNCYDINKDGSLDIVAASWGNGVKCYINTLSADFDFTPPGAVTNLTTVNITTNSITINWTAPADNGTNASTGPVQSYDIRHLLSDINLGNWASATQCTGLPTPAAPGTNQTYQITGLSPATKYYIALRSQDERPNWSPLSNVVYGTTLGLPDTALPGKIYDLQTENPTNNSINLTWTAPADNGSDVSSGPVIEYEIRYNSSAPITNLTWDGSTLCTIPITPGLPGTLEVYNVTGLQPETTYYFAVKARDELPNWGWISNSVSGTTLDFTPPDPISDLLAIDVTDTTINLTWRATGDDRSYGTANEYDIRYATASITDLIWLMATNCTGEPAPQVAGNIEHFQVTDLKPETTYYFAIKASDENSLWSGLSNIAYNTTLSSQDDLAPGLINDLIATQPTSTNVTLSWSAPGDDGNTGMVSGYEIRYNTEIITDALWSISNLCPDFPIPVQPGNQQTYNVTGLLSSTTYYFAVKAYDERPNFSPLSNLASATTLTSYDNIAPAAITDLSASAISENSIKLTWTAPGDDGNSGTATGYDIRYATIMINDSSWASASQCSNEPRPKTSGAQESFTVTGLFASKKYYFAIKTYDERPNISDLSNIPTATTYASDDSTPPGKITDLQVVGTNETTVTLTWTAPGEDGDVGIAIVYEIFYSNVAVTDSNFESAIKIQKVPTPKPAGETEIFLVAGLEEGTTYYFAVRAGDEVPNWAPISNSPFGTTLGTAKSSFSVTLRLDKTIINSGASTTLVVTVLSMRTSQPVQGANVKLFSNVSGVEFNPSNGLTSENGIISFNVRAPEVMNSTEVTIYANITKTGFLSLDKQTMLTIIPVSKKEFNLKIKDNEIIFSSTNVRDGDEITISTTIINLGPKDATGFLVRLQVDDVSIGNDFLVGGLAINTDLKVDMNWTATLGNHTVRVEIIADEPAFESDSSDNSAERIIFVAEKETHGDGEDEGDEPKSAFENWMLIIPIIIIIVILLLLFLVLRKRKKKAAQVTEQISPEDSESYDYEYSEPPQGVEAPEQFEQSEYFEPESAPEQIMETPLQQGFETEEPPQAQEAQYFPEEGDDLTTQEVPEAAEQSELEIEGETFIVAEETTPVIELGQPLVTGSEAALDQETQTEQDQVRQEQEQPQNVACPSCQNLIVINTTPCPHCGTQLNWE